MALNETSFGKLESISRSENELNEISSLTSSVCAELKDFKIMRSKRKKIKKCNSIPLQGELLETMITSDDAIPVFE